MTGLDVPLTPLRFLERAADVYPDKEAVIDGPRRITYGQIAAQATRLARAIQASGVQPGEHVVYVASNSAELIAAHFAVPLAGAVLVAINTRLSSPEIAYILEHCEAQLVIADSSLAEVHREVLSAYNAEVVILPEQDGSARTVAGGTAYDEFLERGSDEPLPWTVEDECATISLNYTSGTTGRPKGVMYTHRGAYLNALGQCLHQGFDSTTRYLWTLPMFHCNGWCSVWGITGMGGTHICLRAVRGPEIWRLIKAEQVDHLAGAPTVLSVMANSPEASPVSHPLTVATAGAPPSPTIIGTFNGLGTRLVHVYGLTETYGPYTVCEPQDAWAELDATQVSVRMARQGVGMVTACDVRVIQLDAADALGQLVDVPRDGTTVGEIVMSGNIVMKGYFRDEDATNDSFVGGWFHSGDLGVRHPDGYVQLVDRAKDIVISGGENISTIEIEQALVSHPAVAEAAVVGAPDEHWGERPVAYVVLNDGSTAQEAELIAHVKSQLAGFKAPGRIEMVEDLPKTSTGKIRKRLLKDREWAATGQ